MNVRLILANLNLVVSLTGTLFVTIRMNVPLMNAFLLMVVRPHPLSVTIMTNVPKTLVILTKDAFLHLSVVMTIMLVPMILAALNLDANTLLDLLMTMIYVPLMNAKKMEKSLIPQLTAMITTHVQPIVVANPLEHVNTKLLNVTTRMLALLILAVLHLVASTNLSFAKINLAILCLATLNMDVNGIVLSVMMKISVP
jgi:hypothetical protein